MNLFQFIETKNSNPNKRAEILHDYRVIVILQALIIFSALILKGFFDLAGVNEQLSQMTRDIIFLSLGGLYVYFLWDFLRNLMRYQIVITFLSILILGSYALALYAINPFYDFVESESDKRPYLLFIHSVLFLIEVTVIYFTILDLFRGNKKFDEKLWGSACVFFMIGISFGSMYDLISIASPGAMGVPVALGLDSYTLCIYFSLTTIGWRDAMENAIPLIQNIAVIESVWANLFSLLLVGRLLSHTDEGQ